jgi:hypothetical protein
MKIPGISTAAIDHLRDELIHWLDCYEEKLNEAEELLYRTAAAIRQAGQTLADNMKEFGLELSGWYDLQRLFGEYDPVTGERISGWDRLVAGGMLLASFVPPIKGAGVAGKAAIKGVKAAETAVDVSKLVSQTKNVFNNKIKSFFQMIYHQVIKRPIIETIGAFKKQWENFRENVGSVLQGLQPALAGVGGPVPRMWMSGVEKEAKGTMMNIVGKNGDEVVGKGIEKIDFDEGSLKHIFRDAPGHFPDTSANRKLLRDTASNKENYLGKDKYGNNWYTETRSDGSQVLVLVINGKIRNGGLNPTPRTFNPQTGLSSLTKPNPTNPNKIINGVKPMSLSSLEAYKAMILFLEEYYERTNSDDIAVLLSSMQFLEDGNTADPAIWKDWLDCVQKVRENNK